MNDPRIQIEYSKGKMIAEVICREIKSSIGENKKVYDLAKRCERQYNQITKWQEQNKTCDVPWLGAADYFIPMTEWIVDAVHARAMQVLFSQEPYMTATGESAADVQNATGVTDFVDAISREVIKLRENMDYTIKQMIKLPMSVVKYDWQREVEPLIIKAQAVNFTGPNGEVEQVLTDDPNFPVKQAQFMMNGFQQSEEEDVFVLDEKEIYNAPKLRYITFDDYVWSPVAKRGHRIYWEGDRFWLTINELRLNANQDKFIKMSVDNIIKSMDFGGKEGSEKAIAEREELRESFYWYGRLPFNAQYEIDWNDPEAIEQEVIAIVDYKNEELLDLRHWEYERIPNPDRVYIKGEFEKTDKFIGRSLTQKLYQTQKYLNQFYNTLMNNAWIAMQKVFKRKTTATNKNQKIKIYPGKVVDVDQMDDLAVLEVGDVKSIGMEIEQNLLNFAARLSNIDISQTGTQREKGQRTFGEVMATIKEGNIGLDKFIQNCHEMLRTISKWTVSYYHERMPEGMERKIRGDEEELIFPTKENAELYQKRGVNTAWAKDDLKGRFDFTWRGTSLNSSQEYNIALSNDLQDRYLPIPIVQMNLLAVWDILKRGLIARNIKDWKTILPPKEAIIKEMEMKQANVQAQQNNQKLTNTVKDKLIQKGMPPAEAIKAVQERIGNVQAPNQAV